jgi:hypothetical protein
MQLRAPTVRLQCGVCKRIRAVTRERLRAGGLTQYRVIFDDGGSRWLDDRLLPRRARVLMHGPTRLAPALQPTPPPRRTPPPLDEETASAAILARLCDAERVLARCDAMLCNRLQPLVEALRGERATSSDATARRRHLFALHPDRWRSESGKELATAAFKVAMTREQEVRKVPRANVDTQFSRGDELFAAAQEGCNVM